MQTMQPCAEPPLAIKFKRSDELEMFNIFGKPTFNQNLIQPPNQLSSAHFLNSKNHQSLLALDPNLEPSKHPSADRNNPSPQLCLNIIPDVSVYVTPDISLIAEHQSLPTEAQLDAFSLNQHQFNSTPENHDLSSQPEDNSVSSPEMDLCARYRILSLLAENLAKDLSIKNQVIQVLQTDRDQAHKDRVETESKMIEMTQKLQFAFLEQESKRDQRVHQIANIVQNLTSEVEAVMTNCEFTHKDDSAQLSSQQVHQLQTHLKTGKAAIEIMQSQDKSNVDQMELTLKLKTSNQQIEELRAELDRSKSITCNGCESKEIQSQLLKEERDHLRHELSEMKNQLAEKEFQITRLRKVCSELKEDKAGLNIALQAKQQENSYLKRDRVVRSTELDFSSLGASTITSSTQNTIKKPLGHALAGTFNSIKERSTDPIQQVNHVKDTKSSSRKREVLSSMTHDVLKVKNPPNSSESTASRLHQNSRHDQDYQSHNQKDRDHHQQTRDNGGGKEINSKFGRTPSFIITNNNSNHDQSKYDTIKNNHIGRTFYSKSSSTFTSSNHKP